MLLLLQNISLVLILGEAISDVIKDVYSEWNLKRICLILRDGGSNIINILQGCRQASEILGP